MTDKEIYRELCASHPEIPVYAQCWWLDAVSDCDYWDVALARDEKGSVSAAMPYIVRKKICFTTITRPLQSPFLGIIFFTPQDIKENNYKRQCYEENATFALIDSIEKCSFSYFEQNLPCTFTNWLPFYWKGFRQTTRYTYRIQNISDLDSLFLELCKSKQKHIKKALREGLYTTFDNDVEEFIEFHRYTYHKRGEKDLIDSYGWLDFLRTVQGNPNVRFVFTKNKEGKTLSVFFLAWDSEFAYYLLTGIDQDEKSSGAPSLMLWDTFKFLQGKTKGFDFEGSMTRAIGSSHREFGAKLEPYMMITKYYSTPFRLLKKLLGKEAK